MEILCFFAGVAFFFTKNLYPLYFIAIVLLFKRQKSIILWFLMALFWSAAHQFWLSERSMPNNGVIKHALIDGYIVSIPTGGANKTQFQFQVEHLDKRPVEALILLSCYNNCPDFGAGQHWQLTAKLQKPQNLSNPGGFDYVAWLKARHINWTGYVQRGTAHPIKQDSAIRYPLLLLRQSMAATLSHINPDVKTLGILQALTLGVTTHIDKATWDLFRHTGTTHLMVISGAHIGLVVGLTYGLMKWLWCQFGWLCLRWPAPKFASIIAFSMGAVYSLLAGFGAPAQRALVVCFFMLLRNFCNQRFGVWQAWRYALLSVLIFEPHSVMMPGFYLSFIAVAILILINQRFTLIGLRKTVLMQIACLVGLMPLSLFWFSYGAVNGFAANILAIPWVSFIIVPLSLFTTLFGCWFVIPGTVTILTHAINYLLDYLAWIDSYAFVNVNVSFTHLLSPLAMMVAISIGVLLPLNRLLMTVIIITIASFFPSYEKIPPGNARVDVLDVGQGLAVVVNTAHHTLLYDTGVKFYQGGDMGKLAIIPYLTTLHITHIDKVVISHPDLDHRGGLASLEEKYKIDELIVDDPAFYKRGSPCHHYPSWDWDGITFSFFSLAGTDLTSKNNSSCVLQISNPAGKSVLLSGDIEKSAERFLTDTYRDELASSVLIVPHHGSKTSSTQLFVKHVDPQFAIASYGFDNRYHFPHKQTIQIYHKQNIPLYNTMDCGMVSVELTPQNISKKPTCYRTDVL